MRDGPSWNSSNSGRRSRIEVDLRADAGRPEASIRPAPRRGRRRSDRAPIRPGPSATISRMAACTRFSYSRSSAGGSPQSCLTTSLAYCVPPKRVSSHAPDAAQQHHGAAGVLEGNGHRRGGLHQSHDAQHRRGIDALAQGFVVQADVAAGDRRLEEAAGLGHAFDGFHELRHDLRPLGIAEVQAIGGGHGLRAHGREIAAALGHGQLARLRAAKDSSSGRCRRATWPARCRFP